MPTQPKAGAPRGNRNALKHGFYAKNFQPAERRELQSVSQLSLNAEIDMLRVVIRRVFDLTASLDNPLVAVRYVQVLTRAVTSLDRLIARQNVLHNDRDEFDENIQYALDEIHDFKNERRDDLKKRYAIHKAILLRRLDSIIPPPPGTPPVPDPATLPKPDRELDCIDPFCSYFEGFEPEYYDVYGEPSPIADRYAGKQMRGIKPYGYIHPDDTMKEINAKIAAAEAAAPPAATAAALAAAKPDADPDADSDDVSDADLFDDPSTWDPDEEKGQILPPLT